MTLKMKWAECKATAERGFIKIFTSEKLQMRLANTAHRKIS